MRNKIKKVFDFALTKFPKGKVSKLCCRRVYIRQKFRIFMHDYRATFQCSIPKKNNGLDIEKLFKTSFINNHGFYGLIFLQITRQIADNKLPFGGRRSWGKGNYRRMQGADAGS